MDERYVQTVRLLLRVAADVFTNDIFAMKGGTAINLFVGDMPRLSVDIDVTYTPQQAPRDEALREISEELRTIRARPQEAGLRTRRIGNKDLGETKLIVENDATLVKIEVNAVFRGTVLAPSRRSLHPATAECFSTSVEVPTLSKDELYGSKLIAALDRKHPRDLFDILQMLQSEGMTKAMQCSSAGTRISATRFSMGLPA